MPSLHESVPGHETTSPTWSAPGVAQAQLAQRLPDLVDGLVAHPAQQQVLVDGGAHPAARVAARDVGQRAQLLGAQVAARHVDLDGREALLALGGDVRRAEALELRAVAVGRGVGGRHGGRAVGLVDVQAQALDVELALVDPVALALLVDELAHLVDADLVDQDLDPGAGAVDAQPVLAVEDAEDRLGHLEVLAVVEADEVVERRRDARHDRRAAADADLDAALAVALARDEGDVVDAGQRAVLGRGVEGRLDLARHELRGRVAHEVAHVGARRTG